MSATPESGSADPVAAANAITIGRGWPMRFSSDLTFEKPELAQVRDVWLEKAQGGSIPARTALDMRALKDVLSNLIIHQVLGEGESAIHSFRVAGSAITDIFGNVNGRALDEWLPPPFQERWRFCFDTVHSLARPLRIFGAFELPQADHLSYEAFAAPLLDDDGRPTIQLAVVYFSGRSGGRFRSIARPVPELVRKVRDVTGDGNG